jgi:hypothetical protein
LAYFLPLKSSNLAISISGSRKNKFTFLGVEAPAWQGAKVQEYRDISVPWQRRQAGCIGAQKCEVIFARSLSSLNPTSFDGLHACSRISATINST